MHAAANDPPQNRLAFEGQVEGADRNLLQFDTGDLHRSPVFERAQEAKSRVFLRGSSMSPCSFHNGRWTFREASLRTWDRRHCLGRLWGRTRIVFKAICHTLLPLSITLSFEEGGRGQSAIWKFFRLSAMCELLRWPLISRSIRRTFPCHCCFDVSDLIWFTENLYSVPNVSPCGFVRGKRARLRLDEAARRNVWEKNDFQWQKLNSIDLIYFTWRKTSALASFLALQLLTSSEQHSSDGQKT